MSHAVHKLLKMLPMKGINENVTALVEDILSLPHTMVGRQATEKESPFA